MGAPLLSISLDGRELQCAGDTSGSYEGGGYDNEVMPNGDPNTARVIMTPTKWSITDQPVVVNLSTDDLQYLENKKNTGAKMEVIWTYVDDVSFKGPSGVIEGKMPYDSMSDTVSLSLGGAGQARKL